MEIRLKSNMANNTAVLYSNVIDMTITPYLDVKYPVPSNLYITGSATPGNWQCGCGEPELLSQKFTQINAYTFELDITLQRQQFIPAVAGLWKLER